MEFLVEHTDWCGARSAIDRSLVAMVDKDEIATVHLGGPRFSVGEADSRRFTT
jgi:hypothetical protein